jgi:dihydroflavonol-4-reductase
MILVTGATGLLGARLLYDLTSVGHQVRAVRRPQSTGICLDHYFENRQDLADKITWVEANLEDPFSMADALSGIEQVYHCAAKVSFQSDHKQLVHRVNTEGTSLLINLCIDAGVKKFCHVSSVAALGRNGMENHIDENAVWKSSRINSEYAISKYGAEREVWRGVAEGLEAVIVNPGVIIGPGNWKTDSSALFRQVWKGLKFYTSGITGFVEVSDVSSIMIRLMEKDVSGERFILVSENLPFRLVFDEIAEVFGKPRPHIFAGPLLSSLAWRAEKIRTALSGKKALITRETARSAQAKNFYSSDKIKNLLGFEFRPVVPAIRKTAQIFLSRQNVKT